LVIEKQINQAILSIMVRHKYAVVDIYQLSSSYQQKGKYLFNFAEFIANYRIINSYLKNYGCLVQCIWF